MRRAYLGYDYDDEIPCMLCGRAFAAIHWSHLEAKHGFPRATAVADYKRRFGLTRVFALASEKKKVRNFIASLAAANRHWPRERILQEINARRSAGKPLNDNAVAKDDPHLQSAAVRHFGSWGKALAADGIDPAMAAKRHSWTRAGLIRELRACATNGVVLADKIGRRRWQTLRAAAARRFGSWHDALRAAGLRALHPMKWTKEEVLRRIRLRIWRGLDLTQTAVAHSDLALLSAARRVIGRPWGVIIQECAYKER